MGTLIESRSGNGSWKRGPRVFCLHDSWKGETTKDAQDYAPFK